MKLSAITLPIFLFMTTGLFAQQIDLPLTITNGLAVKTLNFGIDPAATDGRDVALGEAELPPLPPTGVSDVRFTLSHLGVTSQGQAKDYRRGNVNVDTVKVHRIHLQAGTGTTSFIFNWNLSAGITGVLRDLFGGIIVNVPMSGNGGYTLTNLAFTDLEMVITYDAPLPIQLSSFTGSIVEAGVRLDWTTLSETNNYGFEIQKSQNASENFQTIPNSFIPGNGTTIHPHDYTYLDATATTGAWYYRLKQIDLDATVHYTDAILVDILAGVKDDNQPLRFSLEQNFPNPFNPSTTIRYSISSAELVSLKVYNIIGQEVATLVNEVKQAGRYAITWNASGMASGVYYYKLKSGKSVETHKLVLLK